MLVVLRLDEGPDGRTPSGGRRRPVFREIQKLPENGLLILFPRSEVSHHASSRTPRAWVAERGVEGIPDRLVVTVEDVAPFPQRPGDHTGRIKFDLGWDREDIGVTFVDRDFYLAEMRWLIAEGAIEDRWRIEETRQLADYGRALAGQVMYLGGRAAPPEWKPLTPGMFQQLVGS